MTAEPTDALIAKLTARQHAFAAEYLADHNGTQAAIRAGFSPRTAKVQASQLLRHPGVAARVAELKAAATGPDAAVTAAAVKPDVSTTAKPVVSAAATGPDAAAAAAAAKPDASAAAEITRAGKSAPTAEITRAGKTERAAVDILSDIANLAHQAWREGDLKTALKGFELEGKHLGMFKDKSDPPGADAAPPAGEYTPGAAVTAMLDSLREAMDK